MVNALQKNSTTFLCNLGHDGVENIAAFAALFGVAFAAATLLPAQSEAVLIGMQLAGYPAALLVAVASVGNTLGAAVNWALGRYVEGVSARSWFPVSQASVEHASAWYRRWGRWSLLFSWAPIGGDALTVVAGLLREPLWSFLLLVAVAKTGRYVVLAAATAGLIG